MLRRLGHFTVRRRVLVLVSTVVMVGIAGMVGGSVAKHLSSGGFSDPGAESSQAARLLDERFHGGSPDLCLLVPAPCGKVDDPIVVTTGMGLTHSLAADGGWSVGMSDLGLRPLPPLADR